MFILYSTGQIPPKKSRGKGSQGKKTADTTEESVEVSDESDPEPLIRRKTSRRKVVKKKASISVDDNIIPEPDIALELGKSISLAEAEESAAVRKVHDTHARIMTESVPEPARTIRQSSIAFRDTSSVSKKRTSGTSQKFKGIQSLTLAEQEAADIMKALKDSKKMIGRQPGIGGSDEGTGEIPEVPDESIFADAKDDNEETESDSDDIYKYRINVRKNADIEMKNAEKIADITKETTEQPLTSSSFSVPSDYRTKLDDALLKALERHTADLVGKYSMLPALQSSKKQESEKSPEEIIRIKREQEEKKQEPTYTIKSTDKAALEEFDLKSALFKSMLKNKFANRNPANYRLYHALMEALIEDEDAMDKEVADTGKSTKKRRTRESESAKKPSTTKESSKGKDPKVGSKSDLEDTDNAHIPKVPDTTTWFKPMPEEERPASPKPEWVIPPIDLPEADNNWANAFAKAHQDPDENKLHNKIDDIGSFIRWYCRRIGKEELNKADLEGPTFMMVKVNPEGHQIVPNISNPFPLGGPPGQVTIQPQFFFNKDLEYLLTADKERNRALSISKLKAALYHDFGLEELVLSLWIKSKREYDISAAYGITYWWFSRKQFYINKHSEPSDRDAVRSHMRILSVISIKTYERYRYNYLREIVLRRAKYNEYKISEKDFKSLHPNYIKDLNILHIQGKLDHLPKHDKVNLHNADASDFPFKEDNTIVFKPRAVIYKDRDDNRKMTRINEGTENRKWTEDDKIRSEDFIKVIKRRLKIRRIFRSLESFVGGRLRDIDYRLISRTE
ncbi:hypothetical protein Tco_0970041 [Tanacetum coccineum]